MNTNLFSLVIFLFAGFGLTAQIHLPDIKNDPSGLLKIKHQNIFQAEDMLKKSYDLQWYDLPSPSNESVLQASIACDGSEMVVFYREPDYSINIDKGVIKKWQVNDWVNFAGATNQCHAPDIDIDGTIISAAWFTDAYDYGHGSNINGPWVSFSGTLLMNQNNPRSAMAMGLPYMSFACRYSDGMPSSYMMLHIVNIIGGGATIELNGGWRVLYTDVGLKTDIAGDENAWYCVYKQQEFLYVDKGSVVSGQSQYTDLGDGFRYNNPVSNPEIVVYEGKPVVAWFENSNTELLVAEWSGSEWLLIGYDEITTGYFSAIRMAASNSDLYVVYTINDAAVNISVNHWDGSNWVGLPEVQDQSNANIGTADIALYNNKPVVAFTENNQLKVKIYSTNGLGIDTQIPNNPLISCFPNPCQKDFTIDLGQRYENVSFKIKNMAGQVIMYKEFEITNIISSSIEAASGLYFVEVFTNDECIASLKLVKK